MTEAQQTPEQSSDTPTQYDLNTIDGRNALITQWLAELRSGKHKQITSHLHVENKGFCCLGVLSNCIDPEWKVATHATTASGFRLLGNTYSGVESYDQFHTLFGYADATGYFYQLNDTFNKTFSQIADFIEENWNSDTGRMKQHVAFPPKGEDL